MGSDSMWPPLPSKLLLSKLGSPTRTSVRSTRAWKSTSDVSAPNVALTVA